MNVRRFLCVVLAAVLVATGLAPVADAQRDNQRPVQLEQPGWNDIFQAEPGVDMDKPPLDVGPTKPGGGNPVIVTSGASCGTLPDPDDIADPFVLDDDPVVDGGSSGGGVAEAQALERRGSAKNSTSTKEVEVAVTAEAVSAAVGQPMTTLSHVQLPVGALYRYRYVSVTDQVTDAPTITGTDSHEFIDADPNDLPPVTVHDLGDVDVAEWTRAHLRVEAVADVVVLSDLEAADGTFDGQWLLVTVQGACGATWNDSELWSGGNVEDNLSLDMPTGAAASEDDYSATYGGSFEMRRDSNGRVVEILHPADTDPGVQMFRDGLAGSFSVDVVAAATGASVPETDRTTTQQSNYSSTVSTNEFVALRTATIPLEGLTRAASFDLRSGGVVRRSELRDELRVESTKPAFYDFVAEDDGTLSVPHPATLPPGTNVGDPEVDGSIPTMDHYGSPVAGAVLQESHLWLESIGAAPSAVVLSGLAAVSAGGVSTSLTPAVAQEQVRQANVALAPARFEEGLALMAAADAAGETARQRAVPTVLELMVGAMSVDEDLVVDAASQVTSLSLSTAQSQAVIASIATIDTSIAHTALESVLLAPNLPESVEMTAIANTLVLQSPPASVLNAVVARNAGPMGDTANLVAASLAKDSGDPALIGLVEAELLKSLDEPDRSVASIDGLKVLETPSSMLTALNKQVAMGGSVPLRDIEKSAGAWFGPSFRVAGGKNIGGIGGPGDLGDIGMTIDPIVANPDICLDYQVLCSQNWQVLCVGYMFVDGVEFDQWFDLPPGVPAFDVCLEWFEVAQATFYLVEDANDPEINLCPGWAPYICTTPDQAACVTTWATLSNFTLNPSVPGCDSFLYPSTGDGNGEGPGLGLDVPEGAFQWEETIGPDEIHGKFWVRADPTDQSRLATYKAEAGAAIITPTKVQPIVFVEAIMSMDTEDNKPQNNIVWSPGDGDGEPAMEIGQISRKVDFKAYLMGKPVFAKSISWECGIGASGVLFEEVIIGGPTNEKWSVSGGFPVMAGVDVTFTASLGITLSSHWEWSIDACDFLVTDVFATVAGLIWVKGGIEVTATGGLTIGGTLEAGVGVQATVFAVKTPLRVSAQLIYDAANTRVLVEPCYGFRLEPEAFKGTVFGFVKIYLNLFGAKKVLVWKWQGQIADFDLSDKISINGTYLSEGFDVFKSDCPAVAPVTPVIVVSATDVSATSSQQGSVFTNPVYGAGTAAAPLGVPLNGLGWTSGSFATGLEQTAAAFCHVRGFAPPASAPTTANDFEAVSIDSFWSASSYSTADPSSASFSSSSVSNNPSAERVTNLACGSELGTGDSPTLTVQIGADGTILGPADSSANTQLLTIGESYYAEVTVTNPDLVNDVVVDTLYIDGVPMSGCEVLVLAGSSDTLTCQVPLVPSAQDDALMSRTASLSINGNDTPSSTTSWFYRVDTANAPVDIITTIGINTNASESAGDVFSPTATAPGPVLHASPAVAPEVEILINGGLTEMSNVQALAPFNLACVTPNTAPDPHWVCTGPVSSLTAAQANQPAVFVAQDASGASISWQKTWYATTIEVDASASVKVDGNYANSSPGPKTEGPNTVISANIMIVANVDVGDLAAEVQIFGGSNATMTCSGAGAIRECSVTIAKASLPTDQHVVGNIVMTISTAFETTTASRVFYIDNMDGGDVITSHSEGDVVDIGQGPGATGTGSFIVEGDLLGGEVSLSFDNFPATGVDERVRWIHSDPETGRWKAEIVPRAGGTQTLTATVTNSLVGTKIEQIDLNIVAPDPGETIMFYEAVNLADYPGVQVTSHTRHYASSPDANARFLLDEFGHPAKAPEQDVTITGLPAELTAKLQQMLEAGLRPVLFTAATNTSTGPVAIPIDNELFDNSPLGPLPPQGELADYGLAIQTPDQNGSVTLDDSGTMTISGGGTPVLEDVFRQLDQSYDRTWDAMSGTGVGFGKKLNYSYEAGVNSQATVDFDEDFVIKIGRWWNPTVQQFRAGGTVTVNGGASPFMGGEVTVQHGQFDRILHYRYALPVFGFPTTIEYEAIPRYGATINGRVDGSVGLNGSVYTKWEAIADTSDLDAPMTIVSPLDTGVTVPTFDTTALASTSAGGSAFGGLGNRFKFMLAGAAGLYIEATPRMDFEMSSPGVEWTPTTADGELVHDEIEASAPDSLAGFENANQTIQPVFTVRVSGGVDLNMPVLRKLAEEQLGALAEGSLAEHVLDAMELGGEVLEIALELHSRSMADEFADDLTITEAGFVAHQCVLSVNRAFKDHAEKIESLYGINSPRQSSTDDNGGEVPYAEWGEHLCLHAPLMMLGRDAGGFAQLASRGINGGPPIANIPVSFGGGYSLWALQYFVDRPAGSWPNGLTFTGNVMVGGPGFPEVFGPLTAAEPVIWHEQRTISDGCNSVSSSWECITFPERRTILGGFNAEETPGNVAMTDSGDEAPLFVTHEMFAVLDQDCVMWEAPVGLNQATFGVPDRKNLFIVVPVFDVPSTILIDGEETDDWMNSGVLCKP